MATATEMTLALGRTVYGGDQSGEMDSDEKIENERIEGRETRLSVTWRLTDEEQDLTLMASVLAEEAERALTQVEKKRVEKKRVEKKRVEKKRVEKKQANRTVHTARSLAESAGTEKHPDVEKRPDAEREPGAETTTAPAESACTGNGNGHAAGPGDQPASAYAPAGRTVPNRNGGQAPAAGGSPGNGTSGNGSPGNGSSRYPAYIPPITKPQQLAIQSHCARHGVADWELRRLLWEMFGKKEPRELSKDQAGELLTALQRDMLGRAADTPAYAN